MILWIAIFHFLVYKKVAWVMHSHPFLARRFQEIFAINDLYTLYVSNHIPHFVYTIRIRNSYQIVIHHSFTQFLSNLYQIHIKSYSQFVSNLFHNSYRNQAIRILFVSLVCIYELNEHLFPYTIESVSIRIKATQYCGDNLTSVSHC